MHYITITLMSLVLLTNYTFTQNAERPSLEKLALTFNTDKGPQWHNYTKIYKSYFEHLRDKPIKFLEIGFSKGASAYMWEKYFPQATLHFLDIDVKALYSHAHNLSARCFLHKIDQSQATQLHDFITLVGGDFDIIIDDGSHMVDHQITSFVTLFPQMKSGGIYVVEDLHTSYWQTHGGAGTCDNPQASLHSAVRFFQSLVDHVNYVGASTQCADIQKYPADKLTSLQYYQRYIHAIHFYDSLCIILKR